MPGPMKQVSLLRNASSAQTGDLQNVADGLADVRTFQATVKGQGAVSATVVIEVSNDSDGSITLATITLSGTNVASDGFTSTAKWSLVRASVTAISGSGAVVNCTAGV